MTPNPTAAAIIPVRGHGRLLSECLKSLRAQQGDLEVIVVDDSPDASLTQPEGVRIVRSHGAGPYAARNLGAAATNADVLLFLDSRSRPRPGWAQALRNRFTDDAVALAATDTRVLGGDSLAASAAQTQQFARLANYTVNPYFRPYAPTCNLAVRHADFDAVSGFLPVRSGGDADLCWRIQDLPGREFTTVDEVFMDWVPRDDLRQYIEQNFRYGGGSHQLRLDWESHGAAHRDPTPYWLLLRRSLALTVRIALAAARQDRPRTVTLLARTQAISFQWGYTLACRRSGHLQRVPLPLAGGATAQPTA